MSSEPTQPEPFNRLKACRHGQMLFNVNDIYIGRSLDLYGEFSEGEIELFRQIVRPGGVVVEVGANIGTHTLFFAAQVGPTGVVLAFEPQRIVFQTLCANLALNSHSNVFAFQQAVGAAAGTVVVPSIDYRRSGNFGGLELGAYQQGEQVPVVTLDSFALSPATCSRSTSKAWSKPCSRAPPKRSPGSSRCCIWRTIGPIGRRS